MSSPPFLSLGVLIVAIVCLLFAVSEKVHSIYFPNARQHQVMLHIFTPEY